MLDALLRILALTRKELLAVLKDPRSRLSLLGPPILQGLSYLIPMRYFLTIIRVLMLKGVGIGSIQTEIIALAVFGAAIMGAAALRIRKSLD